MSLIKRDTPRPIKFTVGINPYAHGSVLAEFGNTKVHITPTVQESVPPFLEMAVKKLIRDGALQHNPIKEGLAAISIGINKNNEIIADLNYEEDSSCSTDMNVVMTHGGKFVELQGTAEGEPFSQEELQSLIGCAKKSLELVMKEQKLVLENLK